LTGSFGKVRHLEEINKDNIVNTIIGTGYALGTGEALNNGTHMIDLLRWGMQVDYPLRLAQNLVAV